ncbi:hypothetical protein IEQ34_014115 [Dendrobium chrysotoxum]|uniref:SKP1 component dimerisation domain-containing protein n=1 Tax=Dendrobium chrysotoxum TaxID=161865 RepID=A0AAV7GKL9_DENCH|nr:hypothetical protein IEQ34_014115 [Dendrobium chrysotoxum]
MANEVTKMIRMMASNGVEVVVEQVVAMQSPIIRHMHLDFSLPNIEELKDFDNKFVDIDINALYDRIMATNYLGVKDLIDLVCYKVANMIRGKSLEEIHQIF